MLKNSPKIALLSTALLLSPLFFSKGVNAQGVSLSVFPPVIEVEATPPSSPVAPIIIQNNSEDEVKLVIQLIPFKTNNIGGDIVPMPSLLNEGFYPYYKNRIQFLEGNKKTTEVTLAPFESKEVLVNINLSRGDPPGDYYYSIIFLSEGAQPQETSYSQLPAGIASNLLLSIGPKDISTGGISEFDTSTFKTAGPVYFNLKLHNASKHVVSPTGEISIYNLLGRKVGTVKLLPQQYVLAGGDRYLLDQAQASKSAGISQGQNNLPVAVWPEKFLLGWYKAETTVRLSEGSEPLKAATYFIAFPLYFFIPLVGILFVAISIYLRVKKKI